MLELELNARLWSLMWQCAVVSPPCNSNFTDEQAASARAQVQSANLPGGKAVSTEQRSGLSEQ